MYFHQKYQNINAVLGKKIHDIKGR